MDKGILRSVVEQGVTLLTRIGKQYILSSAVQPLAYRALLHVQMEIALPK